MSIWQAIGLTVLPNIGGILGSVLTKKNIKTWYEVKIDRPSWRPPDWLFAPVWTTLYTSMGYASFLVMRDGVGQSRKVALGLYASQLALNWAWTPIFFGAHEIGLAAIDNFLMVANVAACIYAFYPINRTASYLMVPYLAWVSFASVLTFNIWHRNRNIKGKKRF